MKNPKNNVNAIESRVGFRNLGISEGKSNFFPESLSDFSRDISETTGLNSLLFPGMVGNRFELLWVKFGTDPGFL